MKARSGMAYKQKIEKAREAIEDVFSDTTVSLEKALDAMEELSSDIECKMDALRGDIQRRDR